MFFLTPLCRRRGAAHITAETVLVQFFIGRRVPEAAGIGRDLVGQHDRAVREASELQLEVHEAYVQLQEIFRKHAVHGKRHFLDPVDLVPGRDLQRDRVVGIQQRVVQVVVL